MYLLTAILLIPIVPAYCLFRALKSTGTLNGVWHGLNLQLSGAFAGYFALVLLVMYTHNVWNPPPPYQEWVATGQLIDADRRQPLDLANISSEPPCIQTFPSGVFRMYFSPVSGPGGKLEFPFLKVSNVNYEDLEINLNPAQAEQVDPRVQITRDGVLIDLHSIPLHRVQLGPYAPSGLPPQKIQASQEPNGGSGS